MAAATPYIGSKISLVSNALIAYEGILYTINSQESTIALQSVRCLGTQGRKEPEIPPSNEIYDFIIFRGQDIKDLTVLETGSPAISDPAILSVNRQPPVQHGAAPAAKGGDKGGSWKGASAEKGAWAKGKGYESEKGKGKGKGWESGKGADYGWNNGWKGNDSGKGRKEGKAGKDGKDAGKGGKDSAKGGKDAGKDGGKGKNDGKGGKNGSKGGEAAKGAKGKGSEAAKGGSSKGKGKGKDGKAEPAKGKGEKAKGESGEKGGRRRGGGGGGSGNGVIGELLPKANSETKRQCAEDFDFSSSTQKFDKVEGSENLKPLDGYNKGKSFFDNISCQATERTGEVGRPRADREKVREADLEAFGDAKPPSTRERRGKGRRKGGKAEEN